MQLRNEILVEHSKKQTKKIADWVCRDKKRFKSLMNLFFYDVPIIVQRSAWIMRFVVEEHRDWLRPYIRKMLFYCREPVHNAVKRNVMYVLQNITLPDKLLGLAATISFDLLLDMKEPVAVKVFAMSVLYNITLRERGLQSELELCIGEQMELAKPAFRSRGTKILKQLTRLKGEPPTLY